MATDPHATGSVPLDGNAAGGLLCDLFAVDMTAAEITCEGCGTTLELGAARVYGGAMGSIFRCISCDRAMMRLVRIPSGFVVDMRGARRMVVQSPLE